MAGHVGCQQHGVEARKVGGHTVKPGSSTVGVVREYRRLTTKAREQGGHRKRTAGVGMDKIEGFRAQETPQFKVSRDGAEQVAAVPRGFGQQMAAIAVSKRRATGFLVPLVDPDRMLITQGRSGFMEAANDTEDAAQIRRVTQKMQELHGRRRIGAAE
jgi:hypothetical protein